MKAEMPTSFEDVRVLQSAETIADAIYQSAEAWPEFARDVVGNQIARAADSIGANIAESYGRFHFGEKIQFLYYARGSVFETKYWLNRAVVRRLMSAAESQGYAIQLTGIARQLNLFIASLKTQRSDDATAAKRLREDSGETPYQPEGDIPDVLFDEADLARLES